MEAPINLSVPIARNGHVATVAQLIPKEKVWQKQKSARTGA